MVTVTLSANAGVAIELAGQRIWVDALPGQKREGFSALTPALQQRMLKCEAFFYPDHICFTHCHGDHYSRSLTEATRKLWPKAKLYLPEPEFQDQQLIEGQTVSAGSIRLRFISLPHEGAEFADVKHYGLLISTDGCNILIPGDCAIASPVLEEAIKATTIDLAILDFPWITLGKGRDFLQNTLRAKHILVCHLPFAQDDVNGYRRSAIHAAETLWHPDLRLLLEPMQTEKIEI